MRIDVVDKFCVAIFVVLALLFGYFATLALGSYTNRQVFLISEIVNNQSLAIERRLDRSLSSTRVLAQEVRQHGGLFPDFEEYAQEVIETIGGISNLQLAPNGVIHSIHPLEGNEKAIGHDILKDDARRKEALLALDERHMTLAGPFELIQGGVAVIGRNPVFLKDEVTSEEYFWGFVSALVFLEDLLNVTDLYEYEQKGYAFELSRKHPDSGELVTIASSIAQVGDNTVTGVIEVPNSEWYLRMSVPSPLPTFAYQLSYLFSVLLSMILGVLIRKILYQPQVLKTVVETQTRELRHLAHHDPLTQLPNRAVLKEAVERALGQSKRYKIGSSLLIIDLDNFKPINDLCGHEVGDAVLKIISERIRSSSRETDTVARLGGDEFAVLLDHTETIEDSTLCATRIVEEVRKPVLVADRSHSLSASIGIAFLPNDGENFTTLYRHADLAMYSAKNAGKNQIVFYDKKLQEEAVNRINIQKELEQAIINQELSLYLQPIVDISSGLTVSYEALMRWNHPDKGLIPPDVFIPVAESCDLIFDLGYWAFEECTRIIQLENINVPLSVNLSPKQFRDPNLIDRIKSNLKEYSIPAGSIEIEITESSFIDSIESALATIEKFIECGIHMSLDDFGTGYSSLTLLQRLPVIKVKIDRSFIRDIVFDERDRKIVQGIITTAKNLGLLVVAEGIENQQQLDLLRDMNCDLGQGYFYSKPRPISDYINYTLSETKGFIPQSL